MQQKILHFRVEDQHIHAPHYRVVGDSRNYLVARFSFGENWRGLTKTAVFQGADRKAYHVVLENDRCVIPAEVLRPTRFTVSVFGGDRLTTDRATVAVDGSGMVAGISPPTPTPDVYNQLLSQVETERQLAQAASITAAEKADTAVTAATAADMAAEQAENAAVSSAKSEQNAAACAKTAANCAEETAVGAKAASVAAIQAQEAATTATTEAQAAENSAGVAALAEQHIEDMLKGFSVIGDVTLTENVATVRFTQDANENPIADYKDFFLYFAGKFKNDLADGLLVVASDNSYWRFAKLSCDQSATTEQTFWCWIEEVATVNERVIRRSLYPSELLTQGGVAMNASGASTNSPAVSNITARSSGRKLVDLYITVSGVNQIMSGSRVVLLGRKKR
ncbi:MAG: hypothetical protein IJN07_04760 [Clostridia bacterium]|nr:hypothetical protein [Clostridia bacterium]